MLDNLSTMIAGFCNGVLLVYLAIHWKQVRRPNRVVILAFNALIALSTLSRLFIYKAGVEPAPPWYPVVMDYLLIIICLALIWSIWSRILRISK